MSGTRHRHCDLGAPTTLLDSPDEPELAESMEEAGIFDARNDRTKATGVGFVVAYHLPAHFRVSVRPGRSG
jgi:hypothetical protein